MIRTIAVTRYQVRSQSGISLFTIAEVADFIEQNRENGQPSAVKLFHHRIREILAEQDG